MQHSGTSQSLRHEQTSSLTVPRSLRTRILVACRIVKREPSTALLPLCVFCTLCGLTLWGVWEAADAEHDRRACLAAMGGDGSSPHVAWRAPVMAMAALGSAMVSILLLATSLARAHAEALVHLVPQRVARTLGQLPDFMAAPQEWAPKPPDIYGSLADMVLGMVGEVLAGREVPIDEALMVRSALLQRQDIYTPIDVHGHIITSGSQLDPEVANALSRLLGNGGSLRTNTSGVRTQLTTGTINSSATPILQEQLDVAGPLPYAAVGGGAGAASSLGPGSATGISSARPRTSNTSQVGAVGQLVRKISQLGRTSTTGASTVAGRRSSVEAHAGTPHVPLASVAARTAAASMVMVPEAQQLHGLFEDMEHAVMALILYEGLEMEALAPIPEAYAEGRHNAVSMEPSDLVSGTQLVDDNPPSLTLNVLQPTLTRVATSGLQPPQSQTLLASVLLGSSSMGARQISINHSYKRMGSALSSTARAGSAAVLAVPSHLLGGAGGLVVGGTASYIATAAFGTSNNAGLHQGGVSSSLLDAGERQVSTAASSAMLAERSQASHAVNRDPMATCPMTSSPQQSPNTSLSHQVLLSLISAQPTRAAPVHPPSVAPGGTTRAQPSSSTATPAAAASTDSTSLVADRQLLRTQHSTDVTYSSADTIPRVGAVGGDADGRQEGGEKGVAEPHGRWGGGLWVARQNSSMQRERQCPSTSTALGVLMGQDNNETGWIPSPSQPSLAIAVSPAAIAASRTSPFQRSASGFHSHIRAVGVAGGGEMSSGDGISRAASPHLGASSSQVSISCLPAALAAAQMRHGHSSSLPITPSMSDRTAVRHSQAASVAAFETAGSATLLSMMAPQHSAVALGSTHTLVAVSGTGCSLLQGPCTTPTSSRTLAGASCPPMDESVGGLCAERTEPAGPLAFLAIPSSPGNSDHVNSVRESRSGMQQPLLPAPCSPASLSAGRGAPGTFYAELPPAVVQAHGMGSISSTKPGSAVHSEQGGGSPSPSSKLTMLAAIRATASTSFEGAASSAGLGSLAMGSREPVGLVAPPVAGPGITLYDQVEVQLRKAACSWTFNSFDLDAATRGHPLSCLSYYLLQTSGLVSTFKLDALKLARFVRAVEASYCDNPYHNRIHAADVLQTMHMLVTAGGLAGRHITPLQHLAAYLAAIVHDLEHVGLNNDFLVNTQDTLAIIYNDRSPMENHHLAAAFGLLKRPGCAFLSALPKQDANTVRRTVIDLVLGTDMKQHFSVLSTWATLHKVNTAAGVAAATACSSSGPLSSAAPPLAHSASVRRSALMRKITGSLNLMPMTHAAPHSRLSLTVDTGATADRSSKDESWGGRFVRQTTALLSAAAASAVVTARSGPPRAHQQQQKPGAAAAMRVKFHSSLGGSGLPGDMEGGRTSEDVTGPVTDDGGAVATPARKSLKPISSPGVPTVGSPSQARPSVRFTLMQGVSDAGGARSTRASLESVGLVKHCPSETASAGGASTGALHNTSMNGSCAPSERTSMDRVGLSGLLSLPLAFGQPFKRFMTHAHVEGRDTRERATTLMVLSPVHSMHSETSRRVNSHGAIPRSPHALAALRAGADAHTHGSATGSGTGGTPAASAVSEPAPPKDEGESLLLLQVALKCADLGHLSEELPVHCSWVGRLEEEFFRQGDREKVAGLLVSPLFDRDKPGITKSQVGFFQFVAIPLLYGYTSVFGAARPMWDMLCANYAHWLGVEAAAKAAEASKAATSE